MGNILIRPLKNADLNPAVEVFLDSFAGEAFTRAFIDLSVPANRELYFRTVKQKLALYLEIGHQLYCSLEDSRLSGLIILKSPHIKAPAALKMRRAAPHFAAYARLILLGIRARHLAQAVKPPDKLPDRHYVLEGLAVAPSRQGKGMGKMLLRQADLVQSGDSSSSGIYLYTGDEKNKILYEKYGYRVIEAKEAGEFTAYHMFKGDSI